MGAAAESRGGVRNSGERGERGRRRRGRDGEGTAKSRTGGLEAGSDDDGVKHGGEKGKQERSRRRATSRRRKDLSINPPAPPVPATPVPLVLALPAPAAPQLFQLHPIKPSAVTSTGHAPFASKMAATHFSHSPSTRA